MHKNIKIALLFVVMLGVLWTPFQAKAGILDFFFPSLREEYDPYEKLQAPFAYDPEAPDASAEDFKKGLSDNSPLNTRHRNVQDIKGWVMETVPMGLILNAKNYEEQILALDQYFNPATKQQYLKFMNDTGLMKSLTSGQYDIRAYINDPPELLNEAVVNERYRWAFKVFVVVTLVPSNAKSYRRVEPQNHLATLTVQVGRTKGAENEHGILIERWEGKLEKTK